MEWYIKGALMKKYLDNDIIKNRIESAYQYRFNKELSELASNAIERNKLFNKRLDGTISELEEARYKELVARKVELDSILKAGKEKIIIEVGNKF